MDRTRRIFVAIRISCLQGKIASWQKAHGPLLPGELVPGEKLHVTLVAPWDEREDEETSGVANVIRCLRTIHAAPFTMEFQDVAFIPHADAPGLIWSEERARPQEIYDLTSDIELVLAQRLAEREFEFLPHLTLAYELEESKVSGDILHAGEPIDWTEEVTSFVLMESHKTEEGTRYEVLAEFPLK